MSKTDKHRNRRSRVSSDDRLTVVEHPLAGADLTVLRNKRTAAPEFREALLRISRVLAVEALAGVRTRASRVQTPLAAAAGKAVSDDVIIVPVLRAGLGLLQGFLDVLPSARVGHVGIYRDESTLNPVHYYAKLPEDMSNALVVVLDPMLATGGSARASLDLVADRGATRIALVTLVAAPVGVRNVHGRYPNVRILTCAVDARLNGRGFIVPGLGDAGDRLFGTAPWE